MELRLKQWPVLCILQCCKLLVVESAKTLLELLKDSAINYLFRPIIRVSQVGW